MIRIVDDSHEIFYLIFPKIRKNVAKIVSVTVVIVTLRIKE